MAAKPQPPLSPLQSSILPPPRHTPFSLKYKQNILRKEKYLEVRFDVLVTDPRLANKSTSNERRSHEQRAT